MKLVQFGAGNIGRSFIGQIFSRAGWDVVFVDVAERLVSLLNEKQYYTVVIKKEGEPDEARRIGPVRAVDGRNTAAVAAELAGADLAAVSVGKAALPRVLPVLAAGLAERRRRAACTNDGDAAQVDGPIPLDIIIAENDREAPDLFRSILTAELGPDYPLESLVGIVETSIGKMAPPMKAEDLAADPLLLYAEAYETLIVDRAAFRCPIPSLSAIQPVEPVAAYVDRKLFVHNLGHAAAAYLGYAAGKKAASPGVPEMPGAPGLPDASGTPAAIPQALALPGVEQEVRRAMNQAAAALLLEYPTTRYPGSYTKDELDAHIDDLLFRFKNRALGDTVYRVGRDLPRKLGRSDRLVGAMLLCARHSLPFDSIAGVYRTALEFAAPAPKTAATEASATEAGLFPADREFRERYGLDTGGPPTADFMERILREVSGLDPSRPEDREVYTALSGKTSSG